MKTKFNVLFAVMGVLIIGLVFWNVYLLQNNSELQKEKAELEIKHHAVDAFNEVLKYDLVTSRDSVRILEKKIKALYDFVWVN